MPHKSDEQVTDEQLMDEYYACSEAAFEELVRRHGKWLLRRYGEDVAQETWYKVARTKLTGRSRFDPQKAKFTTWLQRIACRNYIDQLRRLGPLEALDENGPEESRPSAEPDPRGVAAEREREATLWDCVLRLPAHQRDVIILACYLGLSNNEAAEILGIEYNRLASRKHKALQQLRECMENKGYPLRMEEGSDETKGEANDQPA